MGIQAPVSALKQHFEHLFPGKWMSAAGGRQALYTGIAEIDRILPRGLARQRISAWSGSASSGKTTILRAAIAHWCASGLKVAYVDSKNMLAASDWAFIEDGAAPAPPDASGSRRKDTGGQAARFWAAPFWVARSVGQLFLEATEQIIRCGAFDVVVLDLSGCNFARSLNSRTYARLQNALSRSRSALITVDDGRGREAPGWGCHIKLSFRWSDSIKCESGAGGTVAIAPAVRLSVWQDGLSASTEVEIVSNVSNRLFTHPQVPDRRTPKK